MDQKKI